MTSFPGRAALGPLPEAGEAPAQPQAEAHEARDDREPLGLDRVHVGDGDRAAGAQRELEGEQFAAGARGRVGEREALAGDGVLEGLAWSDHAASQYRRAETVHG